MALQLVTMTSTTSRGISMVTLSMPFLSIKSTIAKSSLGMSSAGGVNVETPLGSRTHSSQDEVYKGLNNNYKLFPACSMQDEV